MGLLGQLLQRFIGSPTKATGTSLPGSRFDQARLIGADTAKVSALHGPATAVDAAYSSYPCEEAPCLRAEYGSGLTAFYKDGRLVHYNVEDTAVVFNGRYVGNLLGVSGRPATPGGQMVWTTPGGVRVQAFRTAEDSLDYAVVRKLTQKELNQARRQELIRKQFSSWDGSHYNLTELIKKSMNDPDSYEHVKTVYRDLGSKIIVTTTFRGNNAFGAKILNTVVAEVDEHGNVLNVVQQ